MEKTDKKAYQNYLDIQVEQHFERKLQKIDVGTLRGKQYAPYLCPNLIDCKSMVSIIFMSYGYVHRTELLLNSIEQQEGINLQQVELISFTNHKVRKSNRFRHLQFDIGDTVHKSLILNEGAKKAEGNILLFIDADAILPPYYIANLLYNVSNEKLYTSIRKNINTNLANKLLADKALLTYFDYQGLRDALPDYWDYKFISHTPSGFMHVLKKELFFKVGMYDENFKTFSDYDWEFATRLFETTGQPILIPDMWALHVDHPKDYSGSQIKNNLIEL